MQPIENRIMNKLTRGVPGNRGVLFSRRAHLLTTRQRWAVASLLLVGPCALRGELRFLRKSPDNAAMLVDAGRHCLRGIGMRYAPPYAAMENLPLAAFQHDGYRH